jgi:hypothetical protein
MPRVKHTVSTDHSGGRAAFIVSRSPWCLAVLLIYSIFARQSVWQ